MYDPYIWSKRQQKLAGLRHHPANGIGLLLGPPHAWRIISQSHHETHQCTHRRTTDNFDKWLHWSIFHRQWSINSPLYCFSIHHWIDDGPCLTQLDCLQNHHPWQKWSLAIYTTWVILVSYTHDETKYSQTLIQRNIKWRLGLRERFIFIINSIYILGFIPTCWEMKWTFFVSSKQQLSSFLILN